MYDFNDILSKNKILAVLPKKRLSGKLI